MHLSDRQKRLTLGLVNFTAVGLGTAAAIAQLLGLTSGWSQILLTGVGAAALLYLVIRWVLLTYNGRIQELTGAVAERDESLQDAAKQAGLQRLQIAELQVGQQQYHKAIAHVADHSRSQCRETLEITAFIGVTDEADYVIERHHTKPAYPVPHRTFRPIISTGKDSRPPHIQDIRLQTRGHGSGHITALPLVDQTPLQIWLIFEPSMNDATDWEVEYRTHGLWGPLRQTGVDRMYWNDRPPIGNGGQSILDQLVIKFVFPRSDDTPSVKEIFGVGEVAAARIEDGGNWIVVFRDRQPAGRRYEWEIAHRPAPRRPVPRPASERLNAPAPDG